MVKQITELVEATLEVTKEGFEIHLEDGTIIKEQELDLKGTDWNEGTAGGWLTYTWQKDESIEVVLYTRGRGMVIESVERTLAA